jgi:hypothetical protein
MRNRHLVADLDSSFRIEITMRMNRNIAANLQQFPISNLAPATNIDTLAASP